MHLLLPRAVLVLRGKQQIALQQHVLCAQSACTAAAASGGHSGCSMACPCRVTSKPQGGRWRGQTPLRAASGTRAAASGWWLGSPAARTTHNEPQLELAVRNPEPSLVSSTCQALLSDAMHSMAYSSTVVLPSPTHPCLSDSSSSGGSTDSREACAPAF